jgi:hypothetical protein
MAKSKRIDVKDLTRGSIIALPTDHPDAIHLHPNDYIAIKAGSIDYSRYLNSNLYSQISTPDQFENVDQEQPNTTILELADIPSLTDIESVSYEPYYDTVSKLQKVRALIKIRNSSENPANVAGVDARIFNPSTVVPVISYEDTTADVSKSFVVPNPSKPSVVFKRDGSAISWGWNDSTGLGSFSSVSYHWIISSSSSSSAPALDSGIKNYPSSTNYQIGTSSSVKKYRVSSRNKDTAATTSPRWLRVRTVVVGTDGQTYQSAYSTPL